jgi:NAD(P)-dependent dehydrogenase (short-subunit alcohol dehydrogenase family)
MAEPPHTVFVTGANRGLGLEFARQYAADGWQVFAACRSPGEATDLQAIAARSDGRLRVLELDVTKPSTVRGAAEAVGRQAIDLLINNAGVGRPRGEQFGELDYSAWTRVLEVNTLGPMRVVEALVDNVAKSRDRRIVTITSGMGSIGDNSSGGSYAYRSSKAAVNMVMKSLSVDLAPQGVICVVMNPGWVRTDMGGPRGTLAPEDSIKGMRAVIARLTPADTGKFFNFNGKGYPW